MNEGCKATPVHFLHRSWAGLRLTGRVAMLVPAALEAKPRQESTWPLAQDRGNQEARERDRRQARQKARGMIRIGCRNRSPCSEKQVHGQSQKQHGTDEDGSNEQGSTCAVEGTHGTVGRHIGCWPDQQEGDDRSRPWPGTPLRRESPPKRRRKTAQPATQTGGSPRGLGLTRPQRTLRKARQQEAQKRHQEGTKPHVEIGVR